jgi:perosamine synthetase
MVVGKNTRHMGHIKFLVNQARQVSLGYYHPEIGFNYRMTNLEAAIGLAQMKKLRYFLSRKKTFNRIYRKVLAGAGTVRFQEECPLGESQWWLTCVLLENKVPVQSLLKRLEAAGVPARRVFMPVTQFPPYRKYAEGRYANANHIYEKGLCLPASTLNAEEDIRRSAGILRGLITRTVIR